MTEVSCNVCAAAGLELLYETSGSSSLTSLCERHPGLTRVRACKVCGHLQSDELVDEGTYYDQSYNIMSASEDEDQIYMVQDGRAIYRTDHQVQVLLKKLALPPGTKLLDYGCAKSSTVRKLASKNSEFQPFLFDVSENYVPYWEKFIPRSNWATYQPKSEWHGIFDIVTSFFSLEHITDLKEALRRISILLRAGGVFYGVVPNVAGNIADFIVVDHVNHFTSTSLRRMLLQCGMKVREIDDEAHRGAFVFVAEKASDELPVFPDETVVAESFKQMRGIGEFWRLAAIRIREFEKSLPPEAKVAIYGAGFYGAFITSNLLNPDRIACYLDQNPFLQEKPFHGKPVVAPPFLPSTVDALLVGLNPRFSRRIIAEVPSLAGLQLSFFYM